MAAAAQETSDGLQIVLAVAPSVIAVVGAITAIVLHRGRLNHERNLAKDRLAHERRLADLAVVRQVLARGIELVTEVDAGLEAFQRVYSGAIEQKRPLTQEERDPVNVLNQRWRTYLAELEVLFAEDEPVNAAAKDIARWPATLAGFLAQPQNDGWKQKEFDNQMRETRNQRIPTFRNAVHEVARAEL